MYNNSDTSEGDCYLPHAAGSSRIKSWSSSSRVFSGGAALTMITPDGRIVGGGL